MQLEYQHMHSVETAPMKVLDDMLLELAKSKGVLLVLLDLSAALPTIDQSIWLARLGSFWITGSAQNIWIPIHVSIYYLVFKVLQ